jgi:hypothetical protein
MSADEIRKAAEEYFDGNESFYLDRKDPVYTTILDAMEYAIREDRKRRDKLLAVRYKNMAEKKCEEPATAELKVKSDNEDPNLYHEMRREYEDRMGDGKDDLESMLVELRKYSPCGKVRIVLHDTLGYGVEWLELLSEWASTGWKLSPTEAVRAALDEMKGNNEVNESETD